MSQTKTPKRAPRVAAVIPAAGSGTRLSSRIPKPYVRLAGQPLLIWTLKTLSKSFRFTEIVVSVDRKRMAYAGRLLKKANLARIKVVAGGGSRAASVRNAIKSLATDPDLVLIHDAARPFISKKLVRSVVEQANLKGAALCAIPVTATVKRAKSLKDPVLGTENRNELFLAQTPQVFRTSWILEQYRRPDPAVLGATDEAALFDGTSRRVYLVPGEGRNIKITTPEDLAWASRALQGRN